MESQRREKGLVCDKSIANSKHLSTFKAGSDIKNLIKMALQCNENDVQSDLSY